VPSPVAQLGTNGDFIDFFDFYRGTVPYLARETFLSFEKTLFAQKSALYRDMPKRRKKSKYKYAVIGKKKYYFYKIVWVDPCGDAGHADVDEMKKLLPATMISQAYIFDKNKKYVWTFASYDTDSAVFSDRNCFPRSIILKMEKIPV